MDEPTFLTQHIKAFCGIRGWEPRRMYVTTAEYYVALVSIPSHMYLCPLRVEEGHSRGITYLGCELVSIFNNAVASKIRAWDTAPWPS